MADSLENNSVIATHRAKRMNDHLHPIMQQALQPYMPRKTDAVSELKARINLLELALRRYKPPVPELGVYVYEWKHEAVDEPMLCHLEYFAPEAATDVSPGQQETVVLLNAYVRGCDVYGLLSPDDIEEIEREALACMKRVAEQAKEPV